MRYFQRYSDLTAALTTQKFLPPFTAKHGFHCSRCTGNFPFREGLVPGYAVRRGSDEFTCYPCADAGQREELKARSGPIGAYVSGDATTITTWTGGELGRIVRSSRSRSGFHGSQQLHVRVRDVHGALWYGTGAGAGVFITLRPMKGRR